MAFCQSQPHTTSAAHQHLSPCAVQRVVIRLQRAAATEPLALQLKVVYVLNELLSTVIACHYDASSGELLPTDPVETVPGAEGQTEAAAIRISGDGKFLYVSNRGHDSITVLRVLEDGLVEHLEPVALCSTSVDDGRMVAQWPPRECPRDFALCCKDQYLIVGNQNSDSLVVLERNPELGTLSKIGVSVSCSAPACILPLF
ncbi:unnamed protein product [Cladocopium goreaui]|uniref:6-phosphogluconolactonase n=1 Tax=Cladocopium goreaui TaxID=2562237 RepID=A0A9P1GCX9_9DINO|nr:unnamed protein product [Cladocopium goreaui]